MELDKGFFINVRLCWSDLVVLSLHYLRREVTYLVVLFFFLVPGFVAQRLILFHSPLARATLEMIYARYELELDRMRVNFGKVLDVHFNWGWEATASPLTYTHGQTKTTQWSINSRLAQTSPYATNPFEYYSALVYEPPASTAVCVAWIGLASDPGPGTSGTGTHLTYKEVRS